MPKRICRAFQNYPVYKSVGIPLGSFRGYELKDDQIHEQMKDFHGKIHSYCLDRERGYLYMSWETALRKDEGEEISSSEGVKGSKKF